MDDVLPVPFGASCPGLRGGVFFSRAELDRIMSTYCRGVAAGLWRDYSILEASDSIGFCYHIRASEMPEYRVMKIPALRERQGAFALVGAAGQTLKRSHSLDGILNILERKLLRLVEK